MLSIVITLSLQSSWSESLDKISEDLDNVSGENTEEVLKNVDVNMGTFEVTTDEYGFSETKLVVNVTNNASEKKSYNRSINVLKLLQSSFFHILGIYFV